MTDTRAQTRRIAALIYELAGEIEKLDRMLPHDPCVMRAMLNAVCLERNIRPLMDPADKRKTA